MNPIRWNFMIFTVLAFASLFSVPTMLTAQTAELTATAQRNQIQIADPFDFEIRLVAPSGTKVSFPKVAETIGPFEVLDVTDRFATRVEGDPDRKSWTRTITLETLETGELYVPSIEVSVQENDVAKFLRTDPVKITVASVVESSADLTKFNDIADLHDIDPAEPSSNGFVWISIASIALAAAGGCLLLAKRSPSTVSASTWAIGQLNEKGKDDFGQIERVVRQFLEENFEFPATSLSASAIATQLEERNVDLSTAQNVQEIFDVSQRVKFGGVQISADEQSRLLDNARELIQRIDAEFPADPTEPKEKV
jgi:hypothetical protein